MADRQAPIFESKRLLMRPWTLEDADAAFAIYADAEVTRWLNAEPVPDLDTMRARLEMLIARDAAGGFRLGMWAMEQRDSGEVVGTILLKPLPGDIRVEIGWHLARGHWGQGYATEGAAAALDYGFRAFDLPAIYAITLPDNVRSQAVCRRIGMKEVGTTDLYHGLELNLFERSRGG